MNEDGVRKLAKLSRLELTDAEIAKYTSEISDILAYFDSLKTAVSGDRQSVIESAAERNVMRADVAAGSTGVHTDDVLASAPQSEAGFVKVKNIL